MAGDLYINKTGGLSSNQRKRDRYCIGLFFHYATEEKKPKVVPIIHEDIELVKSLPRGLPELPFFRHLKGISGSKVGEPFGQRYFYKWWKKACKNLGIEGIDLYGGTKHSTAMALRKVATPEEIKRGMMESTNKAFERYFRIETDEVRSLYERTKHIVHPEQHLNNISKDEKSNKILKFKD